MVNISLVHSRKNPRKLFFPVASVLLFTYWRCCTHVSTCILLYHSQSLFSSCNRDSDGSGINHLGPQSSGPEKPSGRRRLKTQAGSQASGSASQQHSPTAGQQSLLGPIPRGSPPPAGWELGPESEEPICRRKKPCLPISYKLNSLLETAEAYL